MTSKPNTPKEQPNTWTLGGQAKSSDVAAMEPQTAQGKTEFFDKLKDQLRKNGGGIVNDHGQVATIGRMKYRIAPDLAALGMDMIRIIPCEVALALSDTAPEPRGKAKHFWIMRLRKLPGRNRLPRGLFKQTLFV